jgi:hypothetical protein
VLEKARGFTPIFMAIEPVLGEEEHVFAIHELMTLTNISTTT